MRIQDEGAFEVHSTVEQLIPVITDPDFIGKTLPDSKGYKVEGPDKVTVQMAVGVSHIRGVMPTHMTILPVVEGEPIKVSANASGLGSRVNLTLAFTLEDLSSDEVRIHWASDASVTGLLASVGAGLLRPLARRNFDAIVASIQAGLEASAKAE